MWQQRLYKFVCWCSEKSYYLKVDLPMMFFLHYKKHLGFFLRSRFFFFLLIWRRWWDESGVWHPPHQINNTLMEMNGMVSGAEVGNINSYCDYRFIIMFIMDIWNLTFLAAKVQNLDFLSSHHHSPIYKNIKFHIITKLNHIVRNRLKNIFIGK